MKPQTLVNSLFACLLTSGIFVSSCTKNEEIYRYPVSRNPDTEIPASIDIHLTGSASVLDYSKVNVDIQGLEYNTSNEVNITEGWERINLDQTGTINLLSLVNGNSIKINNDIVPGNVRQLRLRLGDNNSIEMNGVTKVLHVAQDMKETGLVIFTDAAFSAGYSSALWLNFDATHSIVFDAAADEYSLVPVITGFDPTTTGSIEGIVSPADAKATIHLQTDQSSRSVLLNTIIVAGENSKGYFKLVGLPEGSYQIDIMAGDGTSRRKTITAIEVVAGETKDLGKNILE